MRVYEEMYIDGTWRAATGASIEVTSPTTGETIARVSLASERDIDDAVRAARRAFTTGAWPAVPRSERGSLLRTLALAAMRHADELAGILALDAGIPVSGTANVPGAVARVMYYADLIEELPEEELRVGRAHSVLVSSEPVGVVGAILPWNSPLGIGFMKLAPAIAAGCTIVVKTAPQAPLCWYLIAELVEEVGFPPGVINIVCADRAESEALVRHPEVDKISFTGSTAVGRKVAATCGADLKRCSLELGGKSAAIILDDVDLDEMLPGLVRAATMNNGQACVLQSRVLVPRRRSQEITAALGDRMAALRVGDPLDPTTDIGPIINGAQRSRVEGFIASARDEGATLVTGGGRPGDRDRGWWTEPTLLTDVAPSARIAQEEVFGPVVSVTAYDDEDEAIALANGTPYGLSGTVWTPDSARALRIARAVRSGNFGINVFGMEVAAPFGGMKASGIGRELGPEGLQEYVEPKSVHLPDDWEPGA